MSRSLHFHTICAGLVALGALAAQPSQAADDRPKPVSTFTGHTSPVATLAFSANCSRIVSVCATDVRVWDPATGKELSVLRAAGAAVAAVSPDGKTLAVAIRTGRGAALDSLTLVDADTGKKLFTAESYPDWDRATPYLPTVNALAFSPDGKRLASAGTVGGRWIPEGVVTVWDVKGRKAVRRFDKLSTAASAVTFSLDGRLVAAGTVGIGGELPRGGEAWVWDVGTGKATHTFRPKQAEYGEFVSATDVAFSPDGKRLAVSVSGDSRGQPAGLIVPGGPVFIKVWELPSGKEVLILSGHRKEVGRVAFSPDGKRLASAGKDRVVRLWDAGSGKEIASYPFEVSSIDALGFSPDGRRLAAAGRDEARPGVVRVWACPRD